MIRDPSFFALSEAGHIGLCLLTARCGRKSSPVQIMLYALRVNLLVLHFYFYISNLIPRTFLCFVTMKFSRHIFSYDVYDAVCSLKALPLVSKTTETAQPKRFRDVLTF